jgi:uncharacterized protein (DUF58 family)
MRLFRRKPERPSRPPVARRVQELEIITARLIRLGLAGEYHAAFHGRGLEFAQVREYQPGDDIRTIDWNVTARTGLPHVKQFVEERDLTVVLAVDVSASMSFGSLDRRKGDVAAELAAVLAFAAEQNNDRAGLLLFGDQLRRYTPPRRGRAHIQRLVRDVLCEATRGKTDLERAARFLERVLVKRSVIIFISDFLGVEVRRALRRLAVRHDVIALRITDPREERFPPGAVARLIDAESGTERLVRLSRAEVSSRAAAAQSALYDDFRRMAVDAIDVSTAIPYDRTLIRFFRQRIARMS